MSSAVSSMNAGELMEVSSCPPCKCTHESYELFERGAAFCIDQRSLTFQAKDDMLYSRCSSPA